MNTVENLRQYYHTVAVVSNPIRFGSRYALYNKFVEHMKASGVPHLWTVEVQNGDREFAVTEPNNPYHIQLRTQDELWHKENMINLAVQRFTPQFRDWKGVMWIDADVEFQRRDWFDETIQQLQVNHVVQMFQNAIDLGPNNETLHVHNGFVYSYWNNLPFKSGYANWHPGYAWAMDRESFNAVGGLIQGGILGSGDRHMACSLIGKGAQSYNGGVHPNYQHMVLAWQARAARAILGDIGYVPGTLTHAWHGRKADRQYADRWKVLVDNEFDPYRDVYPDWQGLLQLDPTRTKLRDDIKKYFRARFEDGNML